LNFSAAKKRWEIGDKERSGDNGFYEGNPKKRRAMKYISDKENTIKDGKEGRKEKNDVLPTQSISYFCAPSSLAR